MNMMIFLWILLGIMYLAAFVGVYLVSKDNTPTSTIRLEEQTDEWYIDTNP